MQTAAYFVLAAVLYYLSKTTLNFSGFAAFCFGLSGSGVLLLTRIFFLYATSKSRLTRFLKATPTEEGLSEWLAHRGFNLNEEQSPGIFFACCVLTATLFLQFVPWSVSTTGGRITRFVVAVISGIAVGGLLSVYLVNWTKKVRKDVADSIRSSGLDACRGITHRWDVMEEIKNPSKEPDVAQFADPVAKQALVEALEGSDRELQRGAARLLRAIGKQMEVGMKAVDALAGYDLSSGGSHTLLPEELIYKLKHDQDPYQRRISAEGLDKNQFPGAIEALVVALGDPDENVRESAASSLRTKGEAAVEPLLQALASSNSDVRRLAASELGNLAVARAVEPLISMSADESSNVREGVAYALGRLADPRGIDALNALSRDPDDRVRLASVISLGWSRSIAAVEPLKLALQDVHPGIQESAVGALANIKDPTAAEALLNILDRDFILAQKAANSLAEIGHPAIPVLIRGLSHENESVRSNASWALGKIGEVATPSLLAVLADSNHAGRGAAAFALGNLKSSQALEPIIQLASDEDERVRFNVAHALGKIADPRGIDSLAKLSKDNSSKVRLQAVWSFGWIGSSNAVEALTDCLKDPEPQIREETVAVLEKLAGVCDVCGNRVNRPEGYLLTTREVVSTPAYWQRYYEIHRSEMTGAISSYSEFCGSTVLRNGVATAMAGQRTPWLVCEKCVSLFSVDLSQTGNYAKRWWESRKTFEPPGTGAAPLTAVLMETGEPVSNVWQRAQSSSPMLSPLGQKVMERMSQRAQSSPAGKENPVCPKCQTIYNRVAVIRQLKQQSPELFDFGTWTTKFRCVKCGEIMVISGAGEES